MISTIYGITAAIALALVIGYLVFYKKRYTWLFLLFISVFFVNVGYFSISVSRILEEALLANRISYLGSVFLPLCMFMSVAEVCRIRVPKGVTVTLLCISAAVFLLAASPGYCDLYYKDVSLAVVDGVARLVKTYGKYHIVYLFYLLSYFGSMIAVVAYVIIRKKITSHKYASMLTSVVFLNILIWGIEQLIPSEFEFLSISYIASEVLLLFLFSIMHDFDELKKLQSAQIKESPVVRAEEEIKAEAEAEEKIESEHEAETSAEIQTEDKPEKTLSEKASYILEAWELTELLTGRELEVLTLLLDNCKRKDIAEKLSLSENTVKTHTSHIYTKLKITSRAELVEKANEILSIR